MATRLRALRLGSTARRQNQPDSRVNLKHTAGPGTDDKYATDSRRAGGQARLAAAAPTETRSPAASGATMAKSGLRHRDPNTRLPPPTDSTVDTDRLGRGEWLHDLVRRVSARRLSASDGPTAA